MKVFKIVIKNWRHLTWFILSSFMNSHSIIAWWSTVWNIEGMKQRTVITKTDFYATATCSMGWHIAIGFFMCICHLGSVFNSLPWNGIFADDLVNLFSNHPCHRMAKGLTVLLFAVCFQFLPFLAVLFLKLYNWNLGCVYSCTCRFQTLILAALDYMFLKQQKWHLCRWTV